jgi:bifunctional DNase/RNase
MSEKVECVIHSLRMSLTNEDRIIILQDRDGERFLPIWVKRGDLESILVALEHTLMARPMTHDLIMSLFNTLEAELLYIEIDDLREDIYFAKLHLKAQGVEHIVDSRPSDAIALALRARVPIFVSKNILEEVAIRPEDAMVLENEETGPLPDGDLSPFADFLDTLNSDKGAADSKADDSPMPPEEPEKPEDS